MATLLTEVNDWRAHAAALFREALAQAGEGPILILGHFDADGLSAAAILKRALDRAGRAATVRITGKGESPWEEPLRTELAASGAVALIVTDLGIRADPIAPGIPTIFIDHHRPTGLPVGATIISGHGLDPEPTSALLAWACVRGVAEVDDLLWLAALGLIGDMASQGAFQELEQAQTRWGKTALKDAVALVNAPRRTAAADPTPALTLLLREEGPKAITKGDSPEAEALRTARAEVRVAVEDARKVAPQVRGPVALIRFDSPCQIHPLIAQQWRGRLKDKIVLAANTGYRDGWIHFAARSATGQDLIHFLADHRPPGADSRYGSGHAQATGGALRPADWNAFVAQLGFPDQQVPA